MPRGFPTPLHRATLHTVCWCVALCGIEVARSDEAGDQFESSVRPLLTQYCVDCHGPDEQSGGLRLDSRDAVLLGGEHGPAAVPGHPTDSLMLQAVLRSGTLKMPPDEVLKPSEIDALEAWIQAGMKWPATAAPLADSIPQRAARHWAYQPVQDPPVPVNSASSPVDAFLLQSLQRHKLNFSATADRRTLVRRLSFALTGLPPSPRTVKEFVHSQHPDAWANLVDQLLEDPATAEHRTRQWLDIARYSDTKGYVYGREQRFWTHAWAYRNWLINAMQDDMPYDRFLMLQIAADQLPDARPEDAAAMGFLTVGRRFLGVRRDIIDDQIDVVCRGTMSLTVACARCHDHKYDPIPTADYYSLYGIFDSSREFLQPLPAESPQHSEFLNRYQQLTAEQQRLRLERRNTTSARIRSRIADYLAAQLQLSQYPEAGFDQILAADDLLPSFVHRWRDYLLLAEQNGDPVFAAWHAFRKLDRQQFSRHSAATNLSLQSLTPQQINPLVLDQFATPPQSFDDVIQRYAKLFRTIDDQWQMLAADAQQNQLADPHAEQIRLVLYSPAGPCWVPDEPIMSTEGDYDTATCNELWKKQVELEQMILNDPSQPPFALMLRDRATPVTPRILIRGNPAQPGELVPRQPPQLLAIGPQQPVTSGSGRLELARIIASPKNPVTARVLVNRVWLSLFDRGLTTTPGDFGLRSAPPSHPALLDWLTARFIEDGWSVRALYRRILLSQAFQQSSSIPTDTAEYAIARQVDPANRLLWRMNPHRLSFEEMRDSVLAAAGTLDPTPGTKPAEMLKAPGFRKRTVYGLIDRQFLPAAFRTFDFASPDLHIPKRSETTVPQQALFLMNHPFALNQARALAKSLADLPPPEQIQQLFQRTLQRDPLAAESADFLKLLNSPLPETPAVPKTAADWSYGFGPVDENTKQTGLFTPLPLFNGTAWQGGDHFPDTTLGWVQLTALGGHPGNTREHACIRRWTAPYAGSLNVKSLLKHEPAAGDGIRAFVISSRQGFLTALHLHQSEQQIDHPSLAVEAGETIDFVVDIGDQLNNDQFLWEIELQQLDNEKQVWNSRTDFPLRPNPSLSPLEQLAQVLMCSNEFLFID